MTDRSNFVLNERKNPDKSQISIHIFSNNTINDRNENRSKSHVLDYVTQ